MELLAMEAPPHQVNPGPPIGPLVRSAIALVTLPSIAIIGWIMPIKEEYPPTPLLPWLQAILRRSSLVPQHGRHSPHTFDLANLSVRSDYQGGDTVHVGNGQGLSISHTGSSTLHTPSSSFHLQNIIRCPSVSSNLLSVQKFSKDNYCYFCFEANGFIVKDKTSGRTLFCGQIENGLYPFHMSKHHINKTGPTALFSPLVSTSTWHSRLGHPSSTTVRGILSRFDLPHSGHSISICSSCQLGKSKKLPFSSSSFLTTKPLEIIHSDVWGPAPIPSISGFNYYIIFIDDFSRYSWLFPLTHRSNAYDVFVKFTKLTELDQKIKICRSDGEENF